MLKTCRDNFIVSSRVNLLVSFPSFERFLVIGTYTVTLACILCMYMYIIIFCVMLKPSLAGIEEGDNRSMLHIGNKQDRAENCQYINVCCLIGFARQLYIHTSMYVHCICMVATDVCGCVYCCETTIVVAFSISAMLQDLFSSPS